MSKYPFQHGLMAELRQLEWENDLYKKEIAKYQATINALAPFIVKDTLDIILKSFNVL